MKNFLLFAFESAVAFTLATFLFWLVVSDAEQPPLAQAKKVKKEITPVAQKDVNPSVSEKSDSQEVVSFFDKKSQVKIKSALKDAEGYLDLQRRKDAFAASSFDTAQMMREALLVLDQEYPEDLAETFVEARVLSLHFLGLSQHTTLASCLGSLDRIKRQFDRESQDKIRYALRWDLLGVGKICAKMDHGATSEFIAGMSKTLAKGQLELALRSVNAPPALEVQ